MSLVHNTENNSIQSSKRLGGGEEDMMEAYSIGKVRDGTEVFSDHYDDVDSSGDEIDDPDNRVQGENGKRKRVRKSKLLTEAEKNERRDRNREHAKRSRVRKKFLVESLQHSVKAVEDENEKLRSAIRSHLRLDEAESLIAACNVEGPTVLASDPNSATCKLDAQDFSLVKALQTAQHNFLITDPSKPDNPIVYASQGFLSLTGYELEEVLGRNCRFLQGPLTSQRAVARIRENIEKGQDTTVVLLNYRRDGSTFWNQFFVSALRDGDGNVVNFLGVQCPVSEDYARAFVRNEPAEIKK